MTNKEPVYYGYKRNWFSSIYSQRESKMETPANISFFKYIRDTLTYGLCIKQVLEEEVETEEAIGMKC